MLTRSDDIVYSQCTLEPVEDVNRVRASSGPLVLTFQGDHLQAGLHDDNPAQAYGP